MCSLVFPYEKQQAIFRLLGIHLDFDIMFRHFISCMVITLINFTEI
jgi:hypothetical protein